MRRGAKGVCESWKVVRAFSSWAVSRLGGGGVVFEVVEVWLLFVVVLLGSSGIWTLIFIMKCSWPPLDGVSDDGERRRQRYRMRRSGGTTPWHWRKSVMGSRRSNDVPSENLIVWSRNGRGSMVYQADRSVT